MEISISYTYFVHFLITAHIQAWKYKAETHRSVRSAETQL